MNKAQALYQGYVNAFATYTVNLPIPSKGVQVPYIPVKWFNSKTDKIGATVTMTVDTGAFGSVLGGQHVKNLGINIKSGVPQAGISSFNQSIGTFRHLLKMQVGELKPVIVPVDVTDGPSSLNVLGWKGVLERVKMDIFGGLTKPTFTYSELAVAAMGNAQAYFRSRV